MTALFEVTAADVAYTNDEWYTPRWIFDAAGLTFDLDVCAPVAPEFRTCPARRYLTVLDDGLTAPWDGLVWMNSPYSGPAPWVDRFAAHGNGLALLPTLRSLWMGTLLRSADATTLLLIRDFTGADSRLKQIPYMCLLAACGPVAVSALARIAAADRSVQGAYHVRPGVA